MEVLAYPFRLNSNGRAARVVQGSEAHLAQQAVQFASTRPGELRLAPTYGLEDPTFRTVYPGEIVVGLARFHPDIHVDSVRITPADGEGTAGISIDFSAVTKRSVPPEVEVVFGA